jgi:tRNA-2-methylthio-N6-dimethylallyladenosine synthase
MPLPAPILSDSARGFRPLPLIARPPRREPQVPVLGRAPRVHLWHIGCQMNDADREELAAQLADIGCIPETALEDADIAVLITCTVRANAEQKVFGKFRELIPWKRERPGRAIALTGCMAVEHGEALLSRLPELDYVFDVREPDGFLAKLQALHAPNLDGPVITPASDRLSAYVSVMGGCNEMCTYCIVPFVRGRELSRPLPDVVAHVERLVAQGVREVTLLGQNVNSYHDQQHRSRLPDLLAAVDAVPGLWRLRFLTSHPRNALPDLFAAMRDLHTVCEQLHLPVQAGDDALLRRMRRLYTVDDYRQKIRAAVDTVGPRLALSTDIIVGFCGETEAEFGATEALMRELRFDTVHLAAYSVRPGTAAARRVDDVPREEKRARLNHLLAVQREIAMMRNREYVGHDVEILVEGTAADGRHYGRTRENKVAWLPAGAAAAGELRTARVVEASAWQLQVQTVGAAA